jgi:hypothetical protein
MGLMSPSFARMRIATRASDPVTLRRSDTTAVVMTLYVGTSFISLVCGARWRACVSKKCVCVCVCNMKRRGSGGRGGGLRACAHKQCMRVYVCTRTSSG